MGKLVKNCLRDEHTLIQVRKHGDIAKPDQVVQRAGVGDYDQAA
jgi:hypothetical protein